MRRSSTSIALGAGLVILGVTASSLSSAEATSAPAETVKSVTAPGKPYSDDAQKVLDARRPQHKVVKTSPHARTQIGAGRYREVWTETQANGTTVEVTMEDTAAEAVTKPTKTLAPNVAEATVTSSSRWGKSLVFRYREDPAWSSGTYYSSLGVAYDMYRVRYSDGTHKDWFQIHSGSIQSPSLIYRTTFPGSYGGLLNRYLLEMYWVIENPIDTLAAGDCATGRYHPLCWANSQTSRPVQVYQVASGVAGVGTLATSDEWDMSGSHPSLFRGYGRLANSGKPHVTWIYNTYPGYTGTPDLQESYLQWDNNLAP